MRDGDKTRNWFGMRFSTTGIQAWTPRNAVQYGEVRTGPAEISSRRVSLTTIKRATSLKAFFRGFTVNNSSPPQSIPPRDTAPEIPTKTAGATLTFPIPKTNHPTQQDHAKHASTQHVHSGQRCMSRNCDSGCDSKEAKFRLYNLGTMARSVPEKRASSPESVGDSVSGGLPS